MSKNETINTTNVSRHIYVIAYDSMVDAGTPIYVSAGREKKGTADIQKARRFSSVRTAEEVLKKLKFGNPRIEKHLTLIDEKPIEVMHYAETEKSEEYLD